MARSVLKLATVLAIPLLTATASAQTRGGPPHEWLFGSWTGGLYPPTDTTGPACFAQPTVIFTRDLVMRSSLLDVAYRQRVIETAAATPDGVEIRLSPLPGGGRPPPALGFGCEGDSNLLRVERRGENEIVFPGCTGFLSPLKRCTTR